MPSVVDSNDRESGTVLCSFVTEKRRIKVGGGCARRGRARRFHSTGLLSGADVNKRNETGIILQNWTTLGLVEKKRRCL